MLYATERLDLGPVGYGLLTTTIAVGGRGGTAAHGWITRRISLGDVMRMSSRRSATSHSR